MTEFLTENLKVISHLDLSDSKGRFIPSLMFYTKGQWETWFPMQDGKFMRMQAWPAESTYFGDSPENETDISLHFLDFLSQRANYMDQSYALKGLEDDIFNLSASLNKFELLRTLSEATPGRSRLVATELEYLFSVCRSMFDLLQEIIAKTWNKITLLDGTKTRQLKSSFADMIFESGKLRLPESYADKFGLPAQIISFYQRHGDFFKEIKSLRDSIIHRGKGIRLIFETSGDFAVDVRSKPFSNIYTWKPEELLENNLGRLMPMVNNVVMRTISACDDFTRTIEPIIGFPTKIAPNHQLFIRGYHNKDLLAALQS